jgi:putative nucleotidyltransferase with HDIG domain
MAVDPLTEAMPLQLIALPGEVVKILQELRAPARLAAHLRLVHDVAVKLIDELQTTWPDLQLDREAVRFGAATHDIGKAIFTNELFEAGSRHELEGSKILTRYKVPEHLARFARTHSAWAKDPGLAVEDLLVALADNCWKGKRVDALEQLICREIVKRAEVEEWQAVINLSDIIERLATNADRRLAWQGQF